MESTDQMNNTIDLGSTAPQRIISLVPSQTEYLYDLGLSDEVVGITKFCVHPKQWFKNKTRVGGTKKIKKDVIHSLEPDLIIGNKEENTRDDIEYLQQYYPVWMSDIVTVEDALDMMIELGRVTHKEKIAEDWIKRIKEEKNNIGQISPRPHVGYYIWRNPWMAVGKNTYIHEFLESCGFQNAFSEFNRYPEMPIEKLKNRKLDFIFLSSEPFPFKEKHITELQALLPDTQIKLVDGEMFSWYGSRMKKGFRYVGKLVEECEKEIENFK